jgi:N-acetylglucosamine-6-phosphate deacetylase
MRIAGFVDLQVNGHLGCDFTAPDLAAEDFGQAADKLLAAGDVQYDPATKRFAATPL